MSPPTFPTPENVFENVIALGGYIITFPPFLEASLSRLMDL